MHKNYLSHLMSFILVVFIAISTVGFFHVSNKLFGQDNSASETVLYTEELSAGAIASSTVVTPSLHNWTKYALNMLWNTLKEVLTQAFVNLHETILLAISLWIMGIIRKFWLNSIPKLNNAIDVYFNTTSIQTRNAVKDYVNLLVQNSIDLTEAAFLQLDAQASGDTKAEQDAMAKQAQSRQKLAAAVTLAMQDLTSDGMHKIVFNNKTDNEIVLELINAIEKELMRKRIEQIETTDTNQNIVTSFGSLSTHPVWHTAARINAPNNDTTFKTANANNVISASNRLLACAKEKLAPQYAQLIQNNINGVTQ